MTTVYTVQQSFDSDVFGPGDPTLWSTLTIDPPTLRKEDVDFSNSNEISGADRFGDMVSVHMGETKRKITVTYNGINYVYSPGSKIVFVIPGNTATMQGKPTYKFDPNVSAAAAGGMRRRKNSRSRRCSRSRSRSRRGHRPTRRRHN